MFFLRELDISLLQSLINFLNGAAMTPVASIFRSFKTKLKSEVLLLRKQTMNYLLCSSEMVCKDIYHCSQQIKTKCLAET